MSANPAGTSPAPALAGGLNSIAKGPAAVLDSLGEWMSRHGSLCVTIWSAIYWLTIVRRGSNDPFIFDEIVTWMVARLPSMAAVWEALLQGIDQELPLTHYLVRASLSIFGPSHLAARLPSAFGFWVLMLCVYLLLKRRVAVPYALAGMLLPMVTEAWSYACQARAYGLMLGAGAFAILMWDTAGGGYRGRKLALVGLTLGLVAALSTHMMAVMLGLPLAVGEVLRSLERRRIDFPVWIAFALSIPSVVIYPKVLAAASGLDLNGLYPRPGAIATFYAVLLKPAVLPVLLAAIAVYIAGWSPVAKGRFSLPRYLVIALLACAALPAVFITIAFLSRHFFFVTRYGLLSIIGVAALLAACAASACLGSLRCGAAIVVVLAGWIAVSRVAPVLKRSNGPQAAFAGQYPLLRETIHGELPVLVSDPTAFFLSSFYYSDADAARLHFVTDVEGAARSAGEAINHELLARIQHALPMRSSTEQYSEFVRRNPHFVVYVQNEQPPEWIYALLLRDRCAVTLKTLSGGESLLAVQSCAPTS